MNDRSASWSRLDNAAKIFTSTAEKSDTRVFRFSCNLTEDIDPEILQRAVNEAVKSYPNFLVVMKKGFFWYYIESCDLLPCVEEENLPVCSAIYDENVRQLLFRVSYYRKRINLEVFHVITDGTGALSLLKTIVYRYIIYRYPERFSENPPLLDADASLSQKWDDSFRKYYDKDSKKMKVKAVKAFNIKGEKLDENRLHAIEGIAAVSSVISAAHEYGTTLTVFITSLYIRALGEEMPLRGRKKPVVINIPVNLRQYFPSETARNFFGMISVSYSFAQRSGEFSDIISEVDKAFKEQLTRERLAVRMNSLSSLEHNPAAMIAPLPLKNLVLRCAKRINNKSQTAVISNCGRVKMPAEFQGLIDMFSLFVSTENIEMSLCSYENKLQIGITTSFKSTDIQRRFFRSLTDMGIDVTIRCNDFYAVGKDDENCSTAEIVG